MLRFSKSSPESKGDTTKSTNTHNTNDLLDMLL